MMNEVDKRIEELKSRTKGVYLTQGVSFNKNSKRQMELLKFALENSDSFSGLIKELLAKHLDGGGIHSKGVNNIEYSENNIFKENSNRNGSGSANVGNFI